MDEIFDAHQLRRRAATTAAPATTRCSTRSATPPSQPQRALRELAAKQLGTVGAGNHYVDLFADEHDRVWIGVHFGSRGFGHKTASGFLALAQGLPFDGRAARARWTRQPVAPRRRRRSSAPATPRRWSSPAATPTRAATSSATRCCRILGAEALDEVHNHHNYAWREEHGGEPAGSSARARRRPSPASAASSARRWASRRSSSRASSPTRPRRAVLDRPRRRPGDVAHAGRREVAPRRSATCTTAAHWVHAARRRRTGPTPARVRVAR